jgi:ABC-type sugar transport system substrate-binding protein
VTRSAEPVAVGALRSLPSRCRRRPTRLFIARAAVVLLLCAGCSPQNEEEGILEIGFAAMNVEMTWMKHAYIAMWEKAEELGVRLITYDANNEVAKQAAYLVDLAERGVDGILTDPIDLDALKEPLEEIARMGIPLATFDRKAADAPHLFFVGSDDEEAGRLACRFLSERLQGRGRIVVLEGAMGSSPAFYRDLGFRAELARHPDLEVVFCKSGGFLRREGYRIMEEAIASVDHFDAVYSHNDDMILGALEAMENEGYEPEEIVTMGTDGIPEALLAIRDGRLDGTIQYPLQQAEIALETLIDCLRTEKPAPWEEFLVTPWIITAENLFTADLYHLLEERHRPWQL